MKVKFPLLALAAAAVLSAAARGENPVVVVETSLGTFEVELNEEKAPITVKNFLGYVDDKFYDGTIFHRVKADFMIQGGGMEPGLKAKKPKEPIKNEAGNGLKNDKYTIAMARQTEPDTATSQFFINVVDNGKLNKGDPKAVSPDGYAVFGKVTSGTDVVDKIKEVKTKDVVQNGRLLGEWVPIEDVVIKSISRKKK